MTASSAEITPGSGLKLATNSYTEAAVTVHSQNMIWGEQYLPSYTTVCASSTATANSHLIQVMAGGSLRVRVRQILIFLDTLATTAGLGNISILRLTTAGTGGGTLGVNPLDPADAAAGCTAMSLPTVKGTEGAQLDTGSAYFMQTAGASNPLVQPILVFNYDRPHSKPIIIAAGATNGICVKQETAKAGSIARISILVDESSY